MSNNLSPSQKWWMDLIRCPWCRDIPFRADLSMSINCESCKSSFEFKNNEVEWVSEGHKKKRYDAPRGKIDFFKRVLNPLSNPLLPLSYWSKFRTEQYYQRTLNDKSLAKKWVEHYLSGLNLPKNALILDHGCGRGRNVGLLNQLGYQFAGQDMTSSSWWGNLMDSGFQIVPPDCEGLPWKNSAFDLINDSLVVSYIPVKIFEVLIKEIRRVLKPGGYWVILAANNKSYGQKNFQIKNLLPLDSMRSLAKNNGFKEIDVSYEGFYAPYFPLFINFIRKQCGPWNFDLSDYESWLAEQTPPEKRGLWLMRLRRGD